MALDEQLLTLLQPWRQASAWRLALSGGLDSSVLLHALARLRQRGIPPLSALHVDHGLHSVSADWAAHCRQQCAQLGIELEVIRVQVGEGASLERQAREARYQALTARLGEGEVLLSAQHLDDQAETLLLRLLRGAGVQGLAAMRPARPLGQGWLVRPLLGISRAELEEQARRWQLEWVEDPSNADDRHDRNFLRLRVLPLLRQRWPQASRSLARAAGQLDEAQQLLDERADEDLQAAAGESSFPWLPLPSLRLSTLAALSEARQHNALRRWLGLLGEPMPDRAHFAGWRSLRDAGEDAEPCWKLSKGELRRGAGRLWWLPDSWMEPSGSVIWSDPCQPLELPGNGRLLLEGECPGELRVGYRQGGERMWLEERGHRDLKRLLNERGVPVFLRGRLPLLWRGETLLAVANLPGLDVTGESGARLIWTPPAAFERYAGFELPRPLE